MPIIRKITSKGSQKGLLKNMFKKQGVDLDTYDWESRVDSKLSLQENYSAIKQDLGFMAKRKTDVGTRSVNKADRYSKAQKIFNSFSQRRQAMDGRKQARTTFEIDDLNKKNFNKWKKNPNKYDIFGIDSKY